MPSRINWWVKPDDREPAALQSGIHRVYVCYHTELEAASVLAFTGAIHKEN
jgi:hypothetical protein